MMTDTPSRPPRQSRRTGSPRRRHALSHSAAGIGQPIFGPWHDKMDTLCDGEEAARILSLRAARMGAYRLYTNESVNRAVANGAITPVWREGVKNYYLKSHVASMKVAPFRGRDSASVEDLRQRLETARAQLATDKEAKLSADGRETLQNEIRRLERLLALAEEVEQVVEAYWQQHEKPTKRATRRKAQVEARLAAGLPAQPNREVVRKEGTPKVANV